MQYVMVCCDIAPQQHLANMQPLLLLGDWVQVHCPAQLLLMLTSAWWAALFRPQRLHSSWGLHTHP